MERSHRTLLVCILAVACLLRVAAVMKCAGVTLSGDEPSYDSIAWNLATGHGYYRVDSHGQTLLTATRGPAYVLFLSMFYVIAGHHVVIPLVAQVVLDLASCFLIFRLTQMLFRRWDAAVIAAGLYAFYPQIIRHTGEVLSETFVMFFFLLGLFHYARYTILGQKNSVYLGAAAIGIAGMSKPILLLLPIIFFLANLSRGAFRGNVRNLVIQLGIIGVMMTPWIIRNAIAFHAFIPGVTNGGITFWGGTGPADGKVIGGLGDPDSPQYARDAVKGMTEVQADKWFYRDGMRIIRENPGRYARLMVIKASRLWFSIPYEGAFSVSNKLLIGLNLILGLLSVVGVVALKPAATMSRILLLLVMYFTGIHMVYFSTFRYSLPVYALMFCFSAGGAVYVLDRLVPRWTKITVGCRVE